MSLGRVILLNGPPRCGKDTVAGLLHEGIRRDAFELGEPRRPILHKFAEPLVRGVPAVFGLSSSDWSRLYLLEKETPQPQLLGLTPRQAMISLSEDWLKPKFGQDVFGRLAAESLAATIHDGAPPVVVISDCGFAAEVEPLVDLFGADYIMILRLYREGCSYANDSRSYIERPGLHTAAVYNNGSIESLYLAAMNAVREFVFPLRTNTRTPERTDGETLYHP